MVITIVTIRRACIYICECTSRVFALGSISPNARWREGLQTIRRRDGFRARAI